MHDDKKNGIPGEKVKAWLERVPWEELINTRGNTFRRLPPSRQQGLDQVRAAELILEALGVIKRPLIETSKGLLLGFDPQRYQTAFGKYARGR